MNITELIKPIKLLHGSHPDTAQTGSGCFMNVASYLNGDERITDKPTCVDPVVRALMININDSMSLRERQLLIPFVHRAMRTAGSDLDTTDRRLLTMGRCTSLMLAQFDGQLKEHLEHRVRAMLHCARVVFADREHEAAAGYIGDALMSLLLAARITRKRDVVIDILLQHIDKMLPAAEEPSTEVLQRATALVATAEQHKAHAIG